MISTNEEVSFFIGNSNKETQTLLPSSCHQRLDRWPTQEAHEQVISSWTTDLVVFELNEFDVRYRPTEAIKAQVFVDFITEFTPAHSQQIKDLGQKNGSSMKMVHPLNTPEESK